MSSYKEFIAPLNEIVLWTKKHCNGDTSDAHYSQIIEEQAKLGEKYKGEEEYYNLVLKAGEVIYSELHGNSK